MGAIHFTTTGLYANSMKYRNIHLQNRYLNPNP